jgi:glycosyltransferase involved in cell wall biosynthesis
MKISLITITYNSAATVEKTVQSVLEQDYPDIEYIIVDGLSTDDTLQKLAPYQKNIHRILSEKDLGLYDALNKGIGLATGEIIGFIHSDDFYAHPAVISRVIKAFENPSVQAVYGDLQYVDKEDTSHIIRHWVSGEYRDGLFLKGWMPPHPTFFVRAECYQRYGIFNLQLTSSADYELMLRLIHKHKIKLRYIPEVLVKMRAGGKSNFSLANRLKANREDRQAWKLNGLEPHWYTSLLKPLIKIKQFLGN